MRAYPVMIVFVLIGFAQTGIATESKPMAGMTSSMVKVGPGILKPFYPPSPQEKEIPIETFWLDRYPVTQQEFLNFVASHPSWRRDRISRLFADPQYLVKWALPLSLGKTLSPQAPVTQVSWFAAKSYCESKGKRLATENEWEFAASASETARDGREDKAWKEKTMDWYAKPSPSNFSSVGEGKPNYWGVYDLQGLVWEWVYDFNSNLISSDNREGGNGDKFRFCGAGALSANDKNDYASFMRIAFRSSLQANYTVSNLGFRCAQDGVKEEK